MQYNVPITGFPMGLQKKVCRFTIDALREVSEGVTGALYEVEAGESQVNPFPNIPCARLVQEKFPWVWEEYKLEMIGEKHYENSCD